MAAFIASQRDSYPVPQAVACRALGVSQAWFYKWRHGDASPRHARREQLKVAIARWFAKHHGTYGSPRITSLPGLGCPPAGRYSAIPAGLTSAGQEVRASACAESCAGEIVRATP